MGGGQLFYFTVVVNREVSKDCFFNFVLLVSQLYVFENSLSNVTNEQASFTIETYGYGYAKLEYTKTGYQERECTGIGP